METAFDYDVISGTTTLRKTIFDQSNGFVPTLIIFNFIVLQVIVES